MEGVKYINEININDWRELLRKSPRASYFQSPECYEFYKALSFLEPFGYGLYERGKLIALACGYIVASGGRIKSYFSRRAIVQGGLLLANDVKDSHIERLLDALKDGTKDKAIYLEIRNSNDYTYYKRIFSSNSFAYKPHLNYIVDTSSGIEQVMLQYSESKSRQVRKAIEQGIICQQTKNRYDIDAFYLILNNLYRTKVRKPLFPKEFFYTFVNQPNAYLFVVKQDTTVIGGIACVALQDKSLYEWFVCGDTESYNHLYPSVVATHTAIEFACKNGFEKFDFMGAGNPNKNYGVREFKGKFGGNLVEYGRFTYVANHTLYKLGKTIINKRLLF